MDNPFTLIISAIIFAMYGISCIVSLIFTFSLDTYRKIDETLNISVIQARALTAIERNSYVIDDWLMANNRTAGPLLIALSLIDLKLSFDIINMF